MMNTKEIEDLLTSYHWMIHEVDRLQRVLYGTSIQMRSWGVAKYGVEATLPHGSAGKSQAELRDMDLREERLYKRLQKYQNRCYAIESFAHEIEGEMHKIVYDCIIEGMSYRAIGVHLSISRETVRKMKNEILDQICQSCHFLHLLNPEKSAC